MNSNRKGKVGERDACEALRQVLKIDARRSKQYCGDNGDADLTTSLPGVHWEVKRTERLSLYDAVEQATGDCGEAVPVVLHRRNRGEWLCVVKLEDLPRLAVQVYLQMASQDT